jgi:hypothetical protein
MDWRRKACRATPFSRRASRRATAQGMVRQRSEVRNTATPGVNAVWTCRIGAALDNFRFRILQPQDQTPSTPDRRAWRSLL